MSVCPPDSGAFVKQSLLWTEIFIPKKISIGFICLSIHSILHSSPQAHAFALCGCGRSVSQAFHRRFLPWEAFYSVTDILSSSELSSRYLGFLLSHRRTAPDTRASAIYHIAPCSLLSWVSYSASPILSINVTSAGSNLRIQLLHYLPPQRLLRCLSPSINNLFFIFMPSYPLITFCLKQLKIWRCIFYVTNIHSTLFSIYIHDISMLF